jgi:hypothetical protein
MRGEISILTQVDKIIPYPKIGLGMGPGQMRYAPEAADTCESPGSGSIESVHDVGNDLIATFEPRFQINLRIHVPVTRAQMRKNP